MRDIEFKKVGDMDFETKCLGCDESMLVTVGDRIHFRDGEPVELDGVYGMVPAGFLCMPCNKRENPDKLERTVLFQWIGCSRCGKGFDPESPEGFLPVKDEDGNVTKFVCGDCHDE